MTDETVILEQYRRLIKNEVGTIWPTDDLEVAKLPGPNVNAGYILAAGDGSRPLTELADRHSPLEVLFEKIVDPSRSAEPAIPIDDKNEYRPEGDQAPNDCRNPIHGLFASGAVMASGRGRRLFVSRNPTRDVPYFGWRPPVIH